MDNKYKQLLKNTIWTMFGNTGSKVLSFLLLPLYTKWLGTSGFGLSDLLTTYSSLLVGFMTLCLSDSIFVFTKNESFKKMKIYYSSILYFSVALLLLGFIIFYILNLLFVTNNCHNSFSDNIWYIYAIIVTTFIQQYVQQFVISQEKIKIYSFAGLILCISTFIFSWLLIPKYGVKGFILSIIYSNVIASIYTFLFSKSYKYLGLKFFGFANLSNVLKYSIPLIPNAIMWWLVSALNRPVMEYNLNYSSIGIFAVANRFPSVILTVFSLFAVSWNISVFDEFTKEDFAVFYKKTFRVIFFIITIIALFIIFSSELIISIFASTQFHDAWKYMIILIIGAVANCISSFCGTGFSVVKRSKYLFYSSIWGAVTAILFNFLLIPRIGIWGAALSVSFSFIVMMFARYYYSCKIINVSLIKYIIYYFLVMICAALITIFINNSYYKYLLDIFLMLIIVYKQRSQIHPLYTKIKTKYKY